ncbi:uncharacterized protein LOC118735762 [Rhagoletis pomonella]|uniref:uncharacterized protein LOC118735762 n=1 Tax=Rhagoletis pomonella TaxID=28610 RepID=UPI00177EE3FB|nr:uncharacterized protein LOC118735762 [Rhagoletis pomonella]
MPNSARVNEITKSEKVSDLKGKSQTKRSKIAKLIANINELRKMFLRRAIQVATVLIYWFVIVPVIAKYLEDIKWMRRGKWTRKKLGFYGIAAFTFIFVYFLCMYAYMLCKRWERKILTDMKQSGSKAAESEAPSAATSMATVAEIEPLERMRPTRPALLPAPAASSASARLLTKEQQAQEKDANVHQLQQQQQTGTRSKVKILRSAPKIPTVHRLLPSPTTTTLPVIVTTPLAPLQEQPPYGSELEAKNKRLSRAERLTAELAEILRRYYRMSTGNGTNKATTTMMERV